MFSKKFNIYGIINRITERHSLDYEILFYLRHAEQYFKQERQGVEIYNNSNFDYYYNFVETLLNKGHTGLRLINEILTEIEKKE